MSSTVIKVENVSKQYRLGQVGTGTLSHDLNRWWHSIRGKEDPYLKIGEVNDRTVKGVSDYVWSLKDINFEVKQGEVLGIIGKNGAGKSTLLKILSRVTQPTTGTVYAKGRIASLLEVGTGFHPELSGRDNIFLNGAILGMNKTEISSKFDEIVDFSGVERYIDTPVKRYSSGMYVRLAFAVAAHLEPEILIVDEVLAVGDAEFQERCLGKMKDVSSQGRTVLFVSHNMTAIQSLCTHGLLLKFGQIVSNNSISRVVDDYLDRNSKTFTEINIPQNAERYGTGEANFTKCCISDLTGNKIDKLYYKQKFKINIELDILKKIDDINQFVFWVHICDNQGKVIISFTSIDNGSAPLQTKSKQLQFSSFPDIVLIPGIYSLNIGISNMLRNIDNITNILKFEVSELSEGTGAGYLWGTSNNGFITAKSEWVFTEK